jgi:hypothetical protein
VQYLLMIYADETKAKPAGRELSKLVDDYGEFTRGLVESGRFRAGVRLQPSAFAKTVRERDGEPRTADGPAAGSREQLAGYFLVECERLDEAIAIAARIPGVRFGEAVEVRPVH